ncbi:PD-(D/E)XK nuclease family protein [Shewanella algae]|uniref:PD-(D/E)XK nuclease family protein n=1 Tax=Shewanella algae TaxID=38313 RepID=UPI003C455087
MEIQQIQTLLEHIRGLPKAAPVEPTLFSIGARGHFENPTTDVLAFFFDSNGPHNLGSLVLETLLDILPVEGQQTDHNLVAAPLREVSTSSGRIDLLLEASEWVMVLENKIFYQQNNPFDDYKEFVVKKYQEKIPLFVVLSPSGKAPHGWYGVSYPVLIENLRQKLATYFIEQPLNKWMVLLREFILHLEHLMTNGNAVPPETTDYILKNLNKIREVQQIKERSIIDLQQACLRYIESALPNAGAVSKLHHWYGYPAIRHSFSKWRTKSDVVLFLDGREGVQFCINYYICDLYTPEQHAAATKFMKTEDCIEWKECNNTIACFKVSLPAFDKETMFEAVVRKLAQMDEFETKIRSQF